MPLRLRAALPGLLLVGCVTTPPVHERALINAELCAQMLHAEDLVRAEVYCDLGLEFSPHYADLWVNKGLIALKRGDNKTAKEHFIKALRHNQEQAQAYHNLGTIYLTEKEYGKAADNFRRALRVNPDYLEARYNLGLTFIYLERWDDAKKELRTILAVNPNIADAHHSLGIIAAKTGNFEEATEHIQKAVTLAPELASAWHDLGACYAELGRHCESRSAYAECLRASPNDPFCANQLPIAPHKCGLADAALKEQRDTLTAEQTPKAQYQLAMEYREKGLQKEHERALHKCVQLDGRDVSCHFALHEYYVSTHQRDKASIACKNVLKFSSMEEMPQQVGTCERYLAQDTF